MRQHLQIFSLMQANIVWYTALTGGTAIPSTTALTSGTYFAAIKDPTTSCESACKISSND